MPRGRAETCAAPPPISRQRQPALEFEATDPRTGETPLIEVLAKPADQITSAEIESLITYRVPEGERIEYKQRMPARSGKVDLWEEGKDQIGDHAKNDILREVTAFANAYGGVLVLGIEESTAKPPVAQAISPIPRVHELAERMKMIFRDCVEPQLPRIEVIAVPTSDDDAGVVVFRIGQSRLSPHRVKTTLICPIRRQDRSEKMTMREIQDLTLNLSRGSERLERRLSDRASRFISEYARLETPDNALGVRMTAATVGNEIKIDRVFRDGGVSKEFDTPWCRVTHRLGSRTRQFSALQGSYVIAQSWRPMLRAARAEHRNDPYKKEHNISYRELHDDGLIEFGLVACLRAPSDEQKNMPNLLDPDLPIELFANLVSWADRVRTRAASPTAEYIIEVEIHNMETPVYIRKQGAEFFVPNPPLLPSGSHKFPTYSLGNKEEVPHLLKIYNRDFWNFVGRDTGEEEGVFELIRS